MHLFGYPVAALGVVLMIIGVFGAASTGPQKQGFAAVDATFASILKVLPKLIETLGKAPKWLSTLLMGLLLVLAGDRLAAGAWPFS